MGKSNVPFTAVGMIGRLKDFRHLAHEQERLMESDKLDFDGIIEKIEWAEKLLVEIRYWEKIGSIQIPPALERVINAYDSAGRDKGSPG